MLSTFTFTVQASRAEVDQVEKAIADVCSARGWGSPGFLHEGTYSPSMVAVAVTIAVPNRGDALVAFSEVLPDRRIQVLESLALGGSASTPPTCPAVPPSTPSTTATSSSPGGERQPTPNATSPS